MKLRPLWILACCLHGSVTLAQRDAPVWECYLPSINVSCPDRDADLSIDLVLDKGGGPSNHTEHQMYLLSYLVKDEEEILQISKDIALLDKKAEGESKQFFDVLLKRGLVTIVDTKVAPRHIPRELEGYEQFTEAEAKRLNDFDFSFTISKEKLFESVGKLKHFGAHRSGPHGYYEDDFKLMVFVPVNDSKYATDVKEGVRGEHDFANGRFLDDANGDPLSWSTPILYFRPLPYEFELRRLEEGKDAGKLLLYIN